jgi:hypothetical protein
MTKEVWIAIAQIVIPSIVAVLIALWQVRMMRALATPGQPRPKTIRNIAGQIRHFMNVYGYKVICIGLPVYIIKGQLTDEAPLTKWSIGVIVVNLFFLSFYLSAWYTTVVARVVLDSIKPLNSTVKSSE